MHVPHVPLRREPASQAEPEGGKPIAHWAGPQVSAEAFSGFGDPRLADFLRVGGGETASGASVTVQTALKNTSVFRCVSLIANAIGMLPLHLLRGGDDFEADKATDHPLYRVLHSQPNSWQTAMDFRSHMQLKALVHGDAYARVIRSIGRVTALHPLDPCKVTINQNPDGSPWYEYQPPNGGKVRLKPEDVFHVRNLSDDGLHGMSLVRQAAEAIGLALRTEEAAARLFKNGFLVGGVFVHPGKLSPSAQDNLKASLEAKYSGAENAHRWMVTEEGMKPERFDATAEENQHLETRKFQIEEIARVFGVPRPLLGMDDTSWGTGIYELGLGFVRYALQPWFTAWEQAIVRTLLSERERDTLKPKFNEGALLRGSLQAQAEFFAKALGSGGHQPWMHVDEVRALMNLRKRNDLPPPAGSQLRKPENDPPPPA